MTQTAAVSHCAVTLTVLLGAAHAVTHRHVLWRASVGGDETLTSTKQRIVSLVFCPYLWFSSCKCLKPLVGLSFIRGRVMSHGVFEFMTWMKYTTVLFWCFAIAWSTMVAYSSDTASSHSLVCDQAACLDDLSAPIAWRSHQRRYNRLPGRSCELCHTPCTSSSSCCRQSGCSNCSDYS